MYKYTSGEIPTDSLSAYFARAIATNNYTIGYMHHKTSQTYPVN